MSKFCIKSVAIGLGLHIKNYVLLPAASGDGEGNVFTGVCRSKPGGGCTPPPRPDQDPGVPTRLGIRQQSEHLLRGGRYLLRSRLRTFLLVFLYGAPSPIRFKEVPEILLLESQKSLSCQIYIDLNT